MRIFLKVALFSLIIIGLYTLFAARYVPPIAPEPPPKEGEAVPVTREELVALGDIIYHGKGSCTLCHNAVGGRAPLLDNIAGTAEKRIKDPSYRGLAKNAGEYIYESMVNPSAYVAPGYGVAGTNDKVSPMPDVSGGAIGLTPVEIRAVIAYLESISGT